ncbi:MAG: hypothetical protein E3J72_10660 [Planctomycetota bacterium]|nr:MAG: hypothetical protein E3J72_10660 [Planctomycetota bacterium]
MARRRKTRRRTRVRRPSGKEGKEGKEKRRSQKVERVDMVVITPKMHRVVHWMTAIAFFFTALTGMFHYYRVPIVPEALGSVYALGWVHFGFGVAFFAGMVLVFLIWGFRSLAFGPTEFAWWREMGGYARKFAKPPAAYRFNGGQKLFTLLLSLVSLLLFASGVVMKFWYLVMPGQLGLVNTASMLHVFMVTIILSILLWHLYFSGIATPGRMGAMWGGRVTKEFMELHHSMLDLGKLGSREEALRKRREEELKRKKERMKSARESGRISDRARAIGSGKLKGRGGSTKFKGLKRKRKEAPPPEEEVIEETPEAKMEPAVAEAPPQAAGPDAGMDFDEAEFEDAEEASGFYEEDSGGAADELVYEGEEEVIEAEAVEVEVEVEEEEPDEDPEPKPDES